MTNTVTTDSGRIPILNRSYNDGEIVGLGAGVLGVFAGGSYLAYRWRGYDEQTNQQGLTKGKQIPTNPLHSEIRTLSK